MRKNNKKGVSVIELHELIVIVPEICNLFLSGLIFMSVFNWINKVEIDTYVFLIWSLIANVIITSVSKMLHLFIYGATDINIDTLIVLSCSIAVISPFFISLIYNSRRLAKLMGSISHKTFNNDILDDVVDMEKRNMVAAYIKNTDIYYTGALVVYEEKGKDSYITLIEYEVVDKNSNKVLQDSTKSKTVAVLNMQDIYRLEIYYEDGSRTWTMLSEQ